MSLHQAVNIAIFGLSLRTLNELKEHIQTAIPSHIQVNWSNIAEPHLDILMINHIFFDSPNIKSLIKITILMFYKLPIMLIKIVQSKMTFYIYH